jgi:hypothetical protein
MSMAADRQYLALSRHIATLKQGETVVSKTQPNITGAVSKRRTRVLATMCRLIIASTITGLLVGAAIGRSEMKTYFPRAAPYMPIPTR